MSFLSSLNATKTSSKLKPWGPAEGPLRDYMQQLQSLPQMQAFGGDYMAAMNPAYQNALTSMGNYGQQWLNQGQGLYDQGMGLLNNSLGDYQAQLETQRVAGPRQFQYDQGLFDQTMNGYMPGLESMVGAQGRMSSMGLQSNLGQLVSAAGQAGSLGANPMSKLGQGSAALQAQNTLNNQMFAGNLYNQAAGMANSNAMASGAANMASGQAYDRGMLNGYGQLMNIGTGLANTGYGMQQQGLNTQFNSAQRLQQWDQAIRDAERQKYYDAQNIPMQDVMSRLGMFSNLAAQFGTQKTRNGGSILGGLQGLAGLGQLGMGMYGGFANLFSPSGGGFSGAFSPANMQANALMQQPGYSFTGGY